MKSRQGYKGYVIEARSYEQQDARFSAELWIEEHDASGVTETQFYLPDTFPTEELAIEAAIQTGRQKLMRGLSGTCCSEWGSEGRAKTSRSEIGKSNCCTKRCTKGAQGHPRTP